MLDLLLLDGGNPRSLAYQLDRLTEDLDVLPRPADPRLREEQRLVLEASTALRLADTAALVDRPRRTVAGPRSTRSSTQLLDAAQANAATPSTGPISSTWRRPSRSSGRPDPGHRSGGPRR